MSTPCGLLLDFGCVVSVSPFERHRESERLLGLEPGSIGWLGPVAPETDSLWQAMQRDEISERDYWRRRAVEVGESLGESAWDVTTLLTRTRPTDPETIVRPRMRRLLSAARAHGIRLGMLSNELELFYGAELVRRMRVLDHFDVVVDATHTRVLKPDPRAYALALEALGLSAGEVLFVDDQLRNVIGASKAGLQTQLFELRDVPGSIAAILARLRMRDAD